MANAGRKDLCPQGHRQPVGGPPSPQPSPGPTIWAVSAGRSHPDLGAGKLLASPSPAPGLGAGLGRAWSVAAGLQAWLTPPWALHHTLVPPSTRGMGKKRGGTEISACIQSLRQRGVRCDGVRPRLGIPSPGFQMGSCCVALGCLWAPPVPKGRITSEVTEDCSSMHLPRTGDWPPMITPSCFLGLWGPRWAEGQGAGDASRPSWTLKLCHSSADAPSAASSVWQPSGPCGRREPTRAPASTQLHLCHPTFWALRAEWPQLAWSYRSRLCDPRFAGRGPARHSCCESSSCACGCACACPRFLGATPEASLPAPAPVREAPWLCVCW